MACNDSGAGLGLIVISRVDSSFSICTSTELLPVILTAPDIPLMDRSPVAAVITDGIADDGDEGYLPIPAPPAPYISSVPPEYDIEVL